MSIAGSWRLYPQRYRLEGAKDKKSGAVHFPPRLIDPKSKSREFETVRLATAGTVETFTVMPNPTSEFTDEAPLAVGIVKLDDGVKINTQIVDCDSDKLKIGDRVRVEFRKITAQGEAGIIYYGYKCVPE